MNITSMHTAIEQKLQNLNSQVFENFQPEEIDLFINEMQETFIKQRLSSDSNPKKRGFEESNKRLSDLQSIVKEITLLPIVDSTNPDSRRYLLSNATPGVITGITIGLVYQIVTVGNTTTGQFATAGAPNGNIGTVFVALAAGVGTATVALYDFFLPITSRVNLMVNTRALVVEQGITPRYMGCVSLLTFTPAAGVQGDYYIATATGTYANFSGGVAAVKGDMLYFSTVWSVKTFPVYNFPKYNVPIRIVEHENAFRNQENPLAKATERSPLGVIRENSMMLFSSERFILKDVFLTYLRKPQSVSITSSPVKNCELPEHTHFEIVDLVVNHILEVVESQRYQSSSLESLKNE